MKKYLLLANGIPSPDTILRVLARIDTEQLVDVVFGEDLSQLRKDNSAANMNIIRKLVINILKQTDFSEFTKAKHLSISGKQMLCNKREECLEKVCRNI